MNKEEINTKIQDIKKNIDLIKECDEVYNEILKAKEIEDWGNN